MSNKYLIETTEAYGEKCYDLGNAKEVEVLDYKTLKKMFDKHKDPMLTIKEFIKAEKLLIVKTKTNDTNRNE